MVFFSVAGPLDILLWVCGIKVFYYNRLRPGNRGTWNSYSGNGALLLREREEQKCSFRKCCMFVPAKERERQGCPAGHPDKTAFVFFSGLGNRVRHLSGELPPVLPHLVIQSGVVDHFVRHTLHQAKMYSARPGNNPVPAGQKIPATGSPDRNSYPIRPGNPENTMVNRGTDQLHPSHTPKGPGGNQLLRKTNNET